MCQALANMNILVTQPIGLAGDQTTNHQCASQKSITNVHGTAKGHPVRSKMVFTNVSDFQVPGKLNVLCTALPA
jgi:hypothetical protein